MHETHGMGGMTNCNHSTGSMYPNRAKSKLELDVELE